MELVLLHLGSSSQLDTGGKSQIQQEHKSQVGNPWELPLDQDTHGQRDILNTLLIQYCLNSNHLDKGLEESK